MSAEPVLLEPPDVPVRYLPEATIISLLYQRHHQVSNGAHRFACANHVMTVPFNSDHIRVVDFMAVDCWKGRDGWPVHGFEVKSSRSDWLAELRKPEKAEAARYCDRWWLVVSDERIVRDGELPAGWGLLAVNEEQLGLALLQPARKLRPEPWPRPLVASFARAVAKSARAGAS